MKWLDALLDLLFPPKCPFCGKLLSSRAQLLCDTCQRQLPWTDPTSQDLNPEFTEGCVAPLFYRDNVRESIHRYKFGGRSAYCAVYGQLMAQAVQDAWPDVCFDMVTWVPLSRRRKRKRGYDQAMLLAQVLSETLSLPLKETLVKTRHTPAQSGQTDARARKMNVFNAYEASPSAPLNGKTLLLCDDVVTTGSTLEECARLLRTAGAEQVYAVTLARGKK